MGRATGVTLHESFSHSFDGRGFDRSAVLTAAYGESTKSSYSAVRPSTVYGFGTASTRFARDRVHGSNIKFGETNAATITLEENPPIGFSPEMMAHSAPSRQLPDFAVSFRIPAGKAYATTVSRDAPNGPNGEKRYFVLAKDRDSQKAGVEPPAVFLMAAPRGAGAREHMHEPTDGLMTPAERREALVFQKCNERANHALRKASSDACRLTLVMQRNHPNGMLGVESAACTDTLVYAVERAAMLHREAKHAEHAAARHANIAARRESQPRVPEIIEHNPHDTTFVRLFPRLGRVDIDAARPCTQHYVTRPLAVDHVGFRSNQEAPLAPQRAARVERLNNLDAGSRTYDIITGVQRTTLPTSTVECGRMDRRAHPSNNAIPQHTGMAPTLVGPTPDAHMDMWKPPSSQRSPSKAYLL